MFEEVLSDTFNVFIKNFKQYLILALVISLPLIIISTGVSNVINGGIDNQVKLMQSLKDMGNPESMEKLQQMTKEQQQTQANFPGWAIAFLLLAGLFGNIIPISGVLITNDNFQGTPFSLNDVLTRALKKLPGIIGLLIIMVIACTIGFVLLIIPGIILMVKFSLTLPIYVLEDTSVVTAISRSFELTKGKGWAIFFNVLIFGVLMMIVSWIFGLLSLVSAIVPNGAIIWITQVIAGFAQAIMSFVFVIIVYLVYAKTVGLIPSKGKAEPEWETA